MMLCGCSARRVRAQAPDHRRRSAGFNRDRRARQPRRRAQPARAGSGAPPRPPRQSERVRPELRRHHDRMRALAEVRADADAPGRQRGPRHVGVRPDARRVDEQDGKRGRRPPVGPAAVTAMQSELRIPRSGSAFTTTCAPGALVPGRTTASTGSQPPSRAAASARSSSRTPSTRTSALGPPIRVPLPAASTTPTTPWGLAWAMAAG